MGKHRAANTRSASFTMPRSSTSCPTARSASWKKASKAWCTSREMSWTKRINHPSEVVTQDQKVKVKVLEINKDKQEISLGMKQVEENPWERVAEKYPPGSVVEGKVRNIANYGAFVEIEEGIDGLLHVSDLSWTKKIGHPSEVLKKGETVRAVVLSVDQEKQRIALGLKQMQEDPWTTVIPANYRPGMVVKGHVTKIANFGVFVELEPGLEGLLHISEISDQKVEKPEDLLKVGQELEVKILRVDSDERKIGLSLKRAQWAAGRRSPRRSPLRTCRKARPPRRPRRRRTDQRPGRHQDRVIRHSQYPRFSSQLGWTPGRSCDQNRSAPFPFGVPTTSPGSIAVGPAFSGRNLLSTANYSATANPA